MSDVGQHTTPTVQRRAAVARPKDLIPVRVQCARCPSRVYKYVKVHTLYAYPPGDPRIIREGTDREVHTSYWCLSCARGAAVEEDDGLVIPHFFAPGT